MSDQKELAELLERSKGSDIKVLLAAKEKAKAKAAMDPSPSNMNALDRASRMLDSAMQEETKLKDYQAVLRYVAENGRKLGQSKLYADVGKGRLKKQVDGSFRVKDVDAYMKTLAFAGTPDQVADKVADRMKRKEEADIRRAEAAARREEFNLEVAMGRYIRREEVYVELAGRAVALRDALKNGTEACALELVELVEGKPELSSGLLNRLGRLFDESLGEYARPLTLEVEFTELDEEEGGEA